jgi:hypothetical protein
VVDVATKFPVVEIVTMARGCEIETEWCDSFVGWRGGAYRSPLTGGWLVVRANGVSFRVERLRDARRAVLGGNGRRYGGHTEVTGVLRQDLRGNPVA